MKCKKCGAEFPDDLTACPHCGQSVFQSPPPPRQPGGGIAAQILLSLRADCRKMFRKLRSRLDGFSRLSLKLLLLFSILLLLACLFGKVFSIVLSVLQLLAVLTALLMHRHIIRLPEEQQYIKAMILMVVIPLTLVTLIGFAFGGKLPQEAAVPTETSTAATQAPAQATTEAVTAPPTQAPTEAATEPPATKPPKATEATTEPPATKPPKATEPAAQKPTELPADEEEPLNGIPAPFSAVGCRSQSYSKIEAAFRKAGFARITAKPMEDLTPQNADKLNLVESVSVQNNISFHKGQKFTPSDEVVIQYHTMQRYDVTLNIDFPGNILLSKYDVEVLLDGKDSDTLEHGVSKSVFQRLTAGPHKLTFRRSGSDTTFKDIELTVDSDLEAAFRLACHAGQIDVTPLYIDRDKPLAPGQIKIMAPASVYLEKNYKDVEDAFRGLGFFNIKFKILYDIAIGWTDRGTVEAVTVAGKSDFRRGDIFKSGDEVVITYHMRKGDNSENIVMAQGSSSYEGLDYLEVKQELEKLGFHNIKLGAYDGAAPSHTDGEVMTVEIDGARFKKGSTFKPENEDYNKYWTVQAPAA